jgi:hypothetical protein
VSAIDSPAGGRSGRGPLMIGIIVVALLVLLGGLGIFLLGGRSGDDPPPAPNNPGAAPASSGSAGPPASAAAPAGCADTTAAFRAFAGPRPGMSSEILDRVTSVCWEPTGELRAEATYAADVNATFGQIVTLCRTLSDFIAGSGRPWRGFTAFSTHRLTPGWEFLTATTQGGRCTNPQHTR